MSAGVAIIGGSAEAVTLAEILEKANQSYTLFETPFYPSVGLQSQPYPDNNDWQKVLARFDYVVVAPHPFEFDTVVPIRNNPVAQIALRRPPWQISEGWHAVSTPREAAETLMALGVTKPLVTVGRARLQPFFGLNIPEIIVRSRRKPLPEVAPPCRVDFVSGPFTVEQEMDFLRAENIDCLVAHNAGGAGGRPKLDAAERMDIPVILIDMPPCPWPQIAETPVQAIAWLRSQGVDLPHSAI